MGLPYGVRSANDEGEPFVCSTAPPNWLRGRQDHCTQSKGSNSMKPHACFRVSADEVAQNFRKYLTLAKTQTFEIFEEGKVEVMLVRISAIPEWNRQLQRSIRTDMLTDEEREWFLAPPHDLSHLPESYDDWEDGSG